MKKQIRTPITQEVAFSLDSFKYNSGRLIALILAILLGIGGAVCFAFQGWLLILGVVLLGIAVVFLLSFTVFWKRLLTSISLQNLAKNPLPENTLLLYLFEDEKLTITLQKKGASPQSEEHPYSYFNKIDVTEKYFFLNYGDAKKNPAFPVLADAEVLAYLEAKGIPLADHRKKKA
jgi:hypothetical protein